eukprot:SAG22_NODE_56_length_23716_cov_11.146759_22_plen_39_part_00
MIVVLINYMYTHPSKHAVDGLVSSAYQAIDPDDKFQNP